jgi:hypothetical protein
MIRTFKTQTTINVDSNTAWDAISSRRFVKDFLPEIYKDILGLNLFYLARHKNALEVMPAYVVPNKTIHWNSNANTAIELSRRDLKVNIKHVEINIEKRNHATNISIAVEYDSRFGANFVLIRKIIKYLFSHKLTVLKQNLETNRHLESNLQPTYGYPVF